MATTRLLDYCRRAGGETFVYASSGAVTGAGPKPIEESDTPAPPNLYAISKLAGERVVEQFRQVMRAHALRYFFIYGPGQQGMMMPGIMQRIASGQEVQLAGDDGIALNPVYVEDAARATAAALDLSDSATINVAGPETVNVRQIAGIIGDQLGVEPRFTNAADQPDFVASIELMSALLRHRRRRPKRDLRGWSRRAEQLRDERPFRPPRQADARLRDRSGRTADPRPDHPPDLRASVRSSGVRRD